MTVIMSMSCEENRLCSGQGALCFGLGNTRATYLPQDATLADCFRDLNCYFMSRTSYPAHVTYMHT